ncbi:hypothetical protein E3N88_32727 [Mikania micrantha]|uniref:Receptor-like serine/threonine-protein kinase n=1 Tax=Mikania micrantha TaxID=192012 RepID=A0A5N6LA73_9ASTR|nr:hypothetical protein E3N88_45068 [Mikania micrantha]KAD3337207.1 hypothetical protein E3N88_32727 [Mikania micrantha]
MALVFYFILLISLQTFSVVAQPRNGSVPVGSSLTASEDDVEPWLSPSGDFAFGFKEIQDRFVLAIWYAKIPEQTIVWYPQTYPTVSRGSKVELTSGRGLVLSDPQGVEVWNTSSSISDVAYGFMNDTGNFVIVGSNSSNNWESFDYPADTMLPTQVLERGGVINAKLSQTNFSKGRFQLKFLQEGNIILLMRDIAFDYVFAPYFENKTEDPTNSSNSASQLIFDATGYMYILRPNGQRSDFSGKNTALSSEQYYYRATLDYDGVFGLYYHPKNPTGDTSWQDIWFEPEKLCSRVGRSISENNCTKSCKEDCFCVVAIYNNNTCWKKQFPLLNGRKGRTEVAKALVKYRKSDLQRIPTKIQVEKKDQNTLIAIISTLLGSSLLVNAVLVGLICVGFFMNYRKKASYDYPSSNVVKTNLHHFTYQDLVEATNVFKEELGRGAFGIVYKGVIGTNIVAVKKLDRVFDDSEKEFQAEVNAIARTHHKNLVQLLGYCDEGTHRLLVYEYMSNGALASFLFGDGKPSWKQRCCIAVGIAKGLSYLHEECINQIIHCDIKPQNILLDDYYNAKISDFGLAKLLMMNESRTNTGIRGTKGYVAPEWFRNTPVTVKVDVYSFGVLLLEIISCRKSVKQIESGVEYGSILTDWAWDCYQERILGTFVENDLEAIEDYKKLTTFVMVGLWCVQENPSQRPTMRKVIQMLEGVIEVSEPPCPCPFSITSS